MSLRWSWVAIALCACAAKHTSSAPVPDAGTIASAVPSARALGSWTSVDTLQSSPTIVEKVGYSSSAGNVVGRVCRPADAKAHAVIVINHGGFAGLGSNWLDPTDLCLLLAKKGYVVAEASYRGEGGSDGKVEICLGEVDDVLSMIPIVLNQPYADPSRVAMHGSSHGGCITLRALERGAPVKFASEGFGPTDWSDDVSYLQDEVAVGAGGALANMVLGEVRGVIGNPSAMPAAYAQRSPIGFASSLPSSLPLMIAHGTADPAVRPGQSCAMAKQLGGFVAYHMDTTLSVVTTPPTADPETTSECASITWQPGPAPTQWPNRTLLVFDGVGHEFTSKGGQAMAGALVGFIAQRMPP